MNIINPHNISLNNVIIKGTGKLVIGNNVEVRDHTIIELGDGYIEIGDNSVVGFHSFIQATGRITIGRNSLLGPHNSYICSTHRTKKHVNVRDMSMVRGTITIKDNVWLGANCTINYNTILNNGCVVGANSFVNKDIPEWEIWGGAPARFLKHVT